MNLAAPRLYSCPPPLPAGMTAGEAGAFIRARRKALGLTQNQVVAASGLSGQNYLSALEAGRYHIGHSKHLRRVAYVLRLTDAEIQAINPELFVISNDQGEG